MVHVSSVLAAKETPPDTTIAVHEGRELEQRSPSLAEFALQDRPISLTRHPAWMMVLADAMGHTPYCLEAVSGQKTRGLLPLAYVRSFWFGRFLVSLPYLNSGGVMATDQAAGQLLVDRAVRLAESLDVRFLELRHETELEHCALTHSYTSKVHMRLDLPATSDQLWKHLDSKVRNQVRKGQKSGLTVVWGGVELLADFFAVFSRNMRDLGTPTYGKGLFSSILERFTGQAEICLVRAGGTAVAAALVLHGWGVTDVPSASSLRLYNHTCANMLLYWQLLGRAIQRQQSVFDFGRCNLDSPTYRFKEQWGAKAVPAEWQYHLRKGSCNDMRPENPRYQLLMRLWKRMPVALTRFIGPRLVRGIP